MLLDIYRFNLELPLKIYCPYHFETDIQFRNKLLKHILTVVNMTNLIITFQPCTVGLNNITSLHFHISLEQINFLFNQTFNFYFQIAWYPNLPFPLNVKSIIPLPRYMVTLRKISKILSSRYCSLAFPTVLLFQNL